MTRLLLLCEDYPSNLTNGQHLRVHALCMELCRDFDCFFAYTANADVRIQRRADLNFVEERCLPGRTREAQSWTRHFRLSNSRIVRQRSPQFYRSTLAGLQSLVKEWEIDAIVNFSLPLSEMTAAIKLPQLLDYPDSSTLTITRSLQHRGRKMKVVARLHKRLQLLRQKWREKWVLENADLTTTIAGPDRDQMLEVSGIEPDRIVVVPNGVNPEFLKLESAAGARRRSVVFWGTLDFPPNWTAINYFYDQIFLPYLAEQGIEWHIIGGGAGGELTEVAKHPLVHMAGFQEDLAAAVAGHGVMINPMTEGSGLKNKVLEAFAFRLPVVSTSMGVEAIDAVAGEQFLVSDEPLEFSSMVLRLLDDEVLANALTESAYGRVSELYTWKVVGRKFANTVQRLL